MLVGSLKSCRASTEVSKTGEITLRAPLAIAARMAFERDVDHSGALEWLDLSGSWLPECPGALASKLLARKSAFILIR